MDGTAKERESTFASKYEQHSSLLFQIALVQLGNKHEAEEAVQEAFVRLLRKAPTFDSCEHEKAWLIRVTINICRDMRRSAWLRRTVDLDGIECAAQERGDMDILRELVALPQKYKTVIHLHYVEDVPVRRIAQLLNLSESAVKMRLLRGRELLRLELEGEGR